MSITQRDELAAVIVSAYGEDADELCPCEQDFQVAEAILAAGYRKPRTIPTVEELDALPDGTILRGGGVAYEHHDGWFHGVDGSNVTAEMVSLPAAILWEPKAEVEA